MIKQIALITGLYSAIALFVVVLAFWLFFIAHGRLDLTVVGMPFGGNLDTITGAIKPIHRLSWISLLFNVVFLAITDNGPHRKKFIVAIALCALAVVLTVPFAFIRTSGCFHTAQGTICM